MELPRSGEYQSAENQHVNAHVFFLRNAVAVRGMEGVALAAATNVRVDRGRLAVGVLLRSYIAN
jgi:hypothetical protein